MLCLTFKTFLFVSSQLPSPYSNAAPSLRGGGGGGIVLLLYLSLYKMVKSADQWALSNKNPPLWRVRPMCNVHLFSWKFNYCRYVRTAKNWNQCCGSGSGAFFDPWIRDPGWVKNQDPDTGWTTLIIFPRALKQFFGLKYSNSLMRIRDLGWKSSDPGAGMEKIQIRNKHPRYATLTETVCSWAIREQ